MSLLRQTVAIYRRELLLLFGTPLAWLLLALLTFVCGWLFVGRVELFIALSTQYRAAGAAEALEALNLTEVVLVPMVGTRGTLLLFAAPLMTMRLIADERSRGTFELLLTSPVRPAAIVLGKYLAVLTLVLCFLALSLVEPLLLAAIGTGQAGAVAWPTILSGLLGVCLTGAALTAVGLFFSALSRSQAVAALTTLVFSLLLFLAAQAAPLMEGSSRELLMVLSAGHHLRLLAQGLLDVASLAYFGAWIVLGLFLSHRAIEWHRWAG
ncbi:MAG: ABC transporter permease subunit [Deltaproteobacteria bacterium]|nr:ABC transporter permease subunit [Deltaproteobacteria bacterium]